MLRLPLCGYGDTRRMIELQGTRFNEAECEICPPGYTSLEAASECTPCVSAARTPPQSMPAFPVFGFRGLGLSAYSRAIAAAGVPWRAHASSRCSLPVTNSCNTRHVTCNIPHATRGMQPATYHMQHAISQVCRGVDHAWRRAGRLRAMP